MIEHFKTFFEPFKIKVVEPITLTTRQERETYLKNAHYNMFFLTSDTIIIDLLTDSGTSAMSEEQWAAMMRGDESYAGATSWKHFYQTVHELTGYDYILPTHQGRGAENVLFEILTRRKKYFLANTHFDTTRANIEYKGGIAIDLPCPESKDFASDFPFKGNIDIETLKQKIAELGPENIGCVILTMTNNSGGGQPVSYANAKATSEICKQHGIPFIIDACRIAENCYFIKHKEEGFDRYTYKEIAQMLFSLADGCTMSAKKDAFANIGGFLALKDRELAEECQEFLIITEGFLTYGGLAGRDLEAIAVGLKEVFDPNYLRYRIRSVAYLAEKLHHAGIPVLLPPGGHAVYVDAKAFLPHISPHYYPGQALCCELYLTGGIRAVEIGSVMFGKYDEKGELIPAPYELVRLAIPRRVYTQAHIDFVVEVFQDIASRKETIPGYRIVKESKFLRHFTAHFEPVSLTNTEV